MTGPLTANIDQQAINTLLRLAEEYAGHGKNIAGQSADAVQGAHTDNSLQSAETNLKVRKQVLLLLIGQC